jgi:hypothetical protein
MTRSGRGFRLAVVLAAAVSAAAPVWGAAAPATHAQAPAAGGWAAGWGWVMARVEGGIGELLRLVGVGRGQGINCANTSDPDGCAPAARPQAPRRPGSSVSCANTSNPDGGCMPNQPQPVG